MKQPGSDTSAPRNPDAQQATPSFSDAAAHLRRFKADSRCKTAVIVLACLLVFGASLSIGVDAVQFYPPSEVLSCLALWVQLAGDRLANGPLALYTMSQMMDIQPHFYQVVARFQVSCIAMVCGVLFAVSGTLYQNVFKNPIAAPTMLGAATGFQMGVAVLVVVFGVAAYSKVYEYYLYCYIAAFAVVGAVIAFSVAVSGKREVDTINLLLVGAVFSQLLSAVLTYVCNSTFSDEAWLAYTEISEVLEVDISFVSEASLAVMLVLSMVPVFALRYSLNSLALDDDESRALGLRPSALKIVALVFGTLMIVTAQVHLGTCAMAALVVPHLSRALYGFDFRKQLLGNAVLGALLLLTCRSIVDCISFVGKGFPLGIAVNLVVLPVFVWMLATWQRTWNDS